MAELKRSEASNKSPLLPPSFPPSSSSLTTMGALSTSTVQDCFVSSAKEDGARWFSNFFMSFGGITALVTGIGFAVKSIWPNTAIGIFSSPLFIGIGLGVFLLVGAIYTAIRVYFAAKETTKSRTILKRALWLTLMSEAECLRDPLLPRTATPATDVKSMQENLRLDIQRQLARGGITLGKWTAILNSIRDGKNKDLKKFFQMYREWDIDMVRLFENGTPLDEIEKTLQSHRSHSTRLSHVITEESNIYKKMHENIIAFKEKGSAVNTFIQNIEELGVTPAVKWQDTSIRPQSGLEIFKNGFLFICFLGLSTYGVLQLMAAVATLAGFLPVGPILDVTGLIYSKIGWVYPLIAVLIGLATAVAHHYVVKVEKDRHNLADFFAGIKAKADNTTSMVRGLTCFTLGEENTQLKADIARLSNSPTTPDQQPVTNPSPAPSFSLTTSRAVALPSYRPASQTTPVSQPPINPSLAPPVHGLTNSRSLALPSTRATIQPTSSAAFTYGAIPRGTPPGNQGTIITITPPT